MGKVNLKLKPSKEEAEKNEKKNFDKNKKLAKMRASGKPTRDRTGKIIRSAEYQTRCKSGEVVRVEPNRKWFGNTRVITQDTLQKFINDTKKAMKDPYQMILRPGKLPLSLLSETKKAKTFGILDIESFQNTFGKKSSRTRPKLFATSLEELSLKASDSIEKYEKSSENKFNDESQYEKIDKCFSYGQSRRIWSELHKVIDSSDVVFQVLDARDPMGTRCSHVESFVKNYRSFKHIILILNKCDLIPTSVVKSWIHILSKEYPIIAFRADLHHNFGKSALFQLLRQLTNLHSDKKNISVGFIGYPNVGKSSVINTLVGRKVCNVAPVPGETKVWQYISLMKRVFLIDCPGIVYPSGDTEAQIIMKGVVRAEYIKEPSHYISDILERVKPEYLSRTYGVIEWSDSFDFLQKLAQKSGRLLKGGEPDIETVSKMVINDFQRGKLPHYMPPPIIDSTEEVEHENDKLEMEKQDLEELNNVELKSDCSQSNLEA